MAVTSRGGEPRRREEWRNRRHKVRETRDLRKIAIVEERDKLGPKERSTAVKHRREGWHGGGDLANLDGE